MYIWKEHFCPIENYFRNTTCDFLYKHFSSITFVGDSIMRQFFGGLLIHLTDDRLYGTLVSSLNQQVFTECKGELQFMEKYLCRVSFASEWADIKNNQKYCQFSKQKPKSQYKGFYNIEYLQNGITDIESILLESKPLLVVGIGLHENLDSSRVIERYLKPLLNLVKKNKNATLIWVASPPPTDMKPADYLRPRTSVHVKQYNNAMELFCQENNISFFNTFEMNRGVYSYDGTHYGTELNLVKFRIFIKYLVMLLQ